MGKGKIVIVIDMQVDFVTGSLANKEAQAIVADMKKELAGYIEAGIPVFFTRDTHGVNYLNTQEGRLLPVEHCIEGTAGWQIIEDLHEFVTDANVLDKPSFGCLDLPAWLDDSVEGGIDAVEEIEMCGVCTDICVISNAMILKAAYPEMKITVKSSACAGVTPESHDNALAAMKMCQINVI